MSAVDLQDISNYIDAIQLKEKSIEPSRDKTEFLTRNLQLGNIQKKESLFLAHNMDKSIEMLNFPHDEGGWLTREIGSRNQQKVETMLVLSGSVDGFVRRINQTQINDQTIKDNSKKSFFGGLLGGN